MFVRGLGMVSSVAATRESVVFPTRCNDAVKNPIPVTFRSRVFSVDYATSCKQWQSGNGNPSTGTRKLFSNPHDSSTFLPSWSRNLP